MSFSSRLHEIRDGFERPFWVANISELFERLSYYAAFASLARYLHESPEFRPPNAPPASPGFSADSSGSSPSLAAPSPTVWASGALFPSPT